jgi:hypothetical protein
MTRGPALVPVVDGKRCYQFCQSNNCQSGPSQPGQGQPNRNDYLSGVVLRQQAETVSQAFLQLSC